MPDRRQHRGPHPGDAERFAAAALPALRQACADLAWLFSRGYQSRSALQLVGDRYGLDQRQRQAVRRATCTDTQREHRQATRCQASSLAGQRLWIDGFNVLTTVEAALGGAVVLSCRDGCCRDLASVHGTWRRVAETPAAAQRIGSWLQAHGASDVRWLLDQPVGNSGRLAALLRRLATAAGLPWQVELVPSPDHVLRSAGTSGELVATADSAVLDHGVRWIDLSRQVVAELPDVWRVDLAG